MSNPMLNEAGFKRATGSTLPPPDLTTRFDGALTASAVRTATMTVNGTITATLGLLVLLLAGAYVGWNQVEVADGEVASFPGWSIALVLVGFVAVLVASFKPKLAPILGPVYAVAQGIAVGAISHAYEAWQDGIVVAAVGATLGVFTVMLLLYRFRIIRVTEKLRSIVMGATLGLGLFYLVAMLLNVFGVELSIFNSGSGMAIGFSVLVSALAAFNLLLDFDFIERGARAESPTYMNWFGALGLLVTIVWLYLELLRLLSNLQRD